MSATVDIIHDRWRAPKQELLIRLAWPGFGGGAIRLARYRQPDGGRQLLAAPRRSEAGLGLY